MIGTAVGIDSPGVGIIMRTEDGGITWTHQSVVGMQPENYFGVFMLSPDTGWVVGGTGRILRTTDGGEFWENQSSPSIGVELRKVYFVNSQLGFAVGEQGAIIRTTNGGEIWELIYFHDTFDFYSMQFLDELNGFVGGVPGGLFRTTNGGDSWALTPYNPLSGIIGGIHFFSPDTGLVVGFSGNIAYTTNGGWTFTDVRNGGTNEYLMGVSFPDRKNGIAVGNRGEILRSYNGGLTWEDWQTEITSVNAFYGVCMVTPEISVVVGDEAEIFRTSDSGANWSLVSSGATPVFRDVDFADSQVGVAVGRYGTILRTSDSGITWNFPTLNQAYQQLFDVQFVTPNWGFAVGETNMVKTTDGGLHWYVQQYPGSSWVMGVCFVDTLLGFTCGWDQQIWRTTDGGNTWAMVASFPGAPFKRIAFANANIGVAVGGWETIVRTTDGGDTWNVVHTSLGGWGEFELEDVEFINENIGYVGANWGKLLKTTDGGATWAEEFSSTAHLIAGIDFINQNVGTMVGHNGQILRTQMSSAAVFAADPIEIIFGDVPIGSTATDTVLVSNNGNISLSISSISSTNSAFIVNPIAGTVLPGESKEFIVSFTPAAISNYEGSIIFYHNGATSPDTISVEGDGVTDVRTEVTGIPDDFKLYQNFPNPFNPETQIWFDLPRESHVVITIFNILGQRIETILDTELKAGYHKILWNAAKLPSGIYFYQLSADNVTFIKKGILLK